MCQCLTGDTHTHTHTHTHTNTSSIFSIQFNPGRLPHASALAVNERSHVGLAVTHTHTHTHTHTPNTYAYTNYIHIQTFMLNTLIKRITLFFLSGSKLVKAAHNL